MQKSFSILIEQFRPMVVSYVRAIVGDAHAAEDLAQDTFLAAQKSLDRFDEDGDFGAWLRGIARNHALQHLRKVSRRRFVTDTRIIEGIDDVYGSLNRVSDPDWEQRLIVIRECVKQLSEKLRQAIVFTYRDGLDLRTVAERLNSTPVAVGQRLSRARTRVRVCVHTKLREAEHAK